MKKENLIAQFKEEQHKIKNSEDKYEIKLPFSYVLFGDVDGTSIGLVGEIQKIIESKNTKNISNKLRVKLAQLLDNAIKLNQFSEIYCEALEKHIENLEKICSESLGLPKKKESRCKNEK